WTDAQQIELTKNYRSSKAIINVANFTISRADKRFAPDKVIEPADPDAPVGLDVECVGLAKYAYDGETIAAMIRADMAARARKGGKGDGTAAPTLDSYAV